MCIDNGVHLFAVYDHVTNFHANCVDQSGKKSASKSGAGLVAGIGHVM